MNTCNKLFYDVLNCLDKYLKGIIINILLLVEFC